MKRYQLHFQKEHSLQELVEEVSWALWERGAEDFKLGELVPKGFQLLREEVQKLLKRHVTQYDLCGLGVECQEGAVPSTWGSSERGVVPKELGGWYILEAEQDLRGLVEEFTESVFLLLKEQGVKVVTSAPCEIKASVAEALKGSLGRYLYENISCGETLLCRDAQKLDPWRS